MTLFETDRTGQVTRDLKLEADQTLLSRQWSPAQLKSWSRCPKQFELKYLRQLSWPSDTRNFELGKTVHQWLDYQSRQMSVTSLVSAAPQPTQLAWQLLSQHPVAHWPVVASEWGFQIPMGYWQGMHHWLTGRIDRLAWHNEMLWIIDWKTGTATPRQPEIDWQTGCYLYAIWSTRQWFSIPLKRPEQLRFLYVEAKQAIRLTEIAYDQNRHAYWHEQLTLTLERMATSDAYPLPDRCPDRYCPYGSICGINPST